MPYVWEDNELFLHHAGVDVYHIYRNDCPEFVREFHFATSPLGSDNGSDFGEFDVRDLSTWDATATVPIKRAIITAIDSGELEPFDD